MRPSHQLPRDLNSLIFSAFLQMCFLARPSAFARIRESLDLTQTNIGDALHATRITVSGWENGRFMPIADNALGYYQALEAKAKIDGKDVSWLMNEIFTLIPELYDAIPKMHDARRYGYIRTSEARMMFESQSNEELDASIDRELECVNDSVSVANCECNSAMGCGLRATSNDDDEMSDADLAFVNGYEGDR